MIPESLIKKQTKEIKKNVDDFSFWYKAFSQYRKAENAKHEKLPEVATTLLCYSTLSDRKKSQYLKRLVQVSQK